MRTKEGVFVICHIPYYRWSRVLTQSLLCVEAAWSGVEAARRGPQIETPHAAPEACGCCTSGCGCARSHGREDCTHGLLGGCLCLDGASSSPRCTGLLLALGLHGGAAPSDGARVCVLLGQLLALALCSLCWGGLCWGGLCWGGLCWGGLALEAGATGDGWDLQRRGSSSVCAHTQESPEDVQSACVVGRMSENATGHPIVSHTLSVPVLSLECPRSSLFSLGSKQLGQKCR